uniref:Uncharacterized protein n=2 Tax=Schistocephalus solidus TaxID=70667 RepID=A0A0X3PM15_SCHSO
MVDVSNKYKTAQSIAPIKQPLLESVLQAYGCLKRSSAKSLPLIPYASQTDKPESAHYSLPRRVYVSSQRFPGPKSLFITPLDSFLDPPVICKSTDYCLLGGELIASRRAEKYISTHIIVSTQYSRSHEYEDILQTSVSQTFPILYQRIRPIQSSVSTKKESEREIQSKIEYNPQKEHPKVEEEQKEESKIGDLDVSESSGLTSVLPRSLASSERTLSIPCSQKDIESGQMKRINSHRGSAEVVVNSGRRESRRDSEKTVVADGDERIYNSPTMYQITKVPAQYAVDYLQDSPDALNEGICELKDGHPNNGKAAVKVEKEGPPSRWREDVANTISKRATSVDEIRRRFEESCTVILPKGTKRPTPKQAPTLPLTKGLPSHFSPVSTEDHVRSSAFNLKRSQSASALLNGGCGVSKKNCTDDRGDDQNKSRIMLRPSAVKPFESSNPRSPQFARRIAGTQTEGNPQPVSIHPNRLFRRSDDEWERERVGRRYNPSPTQRRLPGENGRHLSPRSINRAANETLWPDGVYIKAGDVYKRVETNTFANGTSVQYFLPRSRDEPVADALTDVDYGSGTHFRVGARRREFSRDMLEAETRPYHTVALSRSSSSLSLPRSPVRYKEEQMKAQIGGFSKTDTQTFQKCHNLTVDCSDHSDSHRRVGQTSPSLRRQDVPHRGSLPCVSGSRGTARCWRERPSPTLNYSYLEHMEPSTMPYRSNTLSSWSDLRTAKDSLLFVGLPMRKSCSQQHLSPHLSQSVAIRHRFPKAGGTDWRTRASKIRADRQMIHELRGSWSPSPSPPRCLPNDLEEQTELEIRDQVMHGAPVHALKWKQPWINMTNAKVSANLPAYAKSPPSPRAQASVSPRQRNQFKRSGMAGCVDQASISQEFGSNIAFFEQMARENMNEPHCSFGSDCYHCSFRHRLGALRSASPSPSRTRARPYFGSLRRPNLSNLQFNREFREGGRPRVEVINSPGKLYSQVECVSPKSKTGNSFSQTHAARRSVRRLGDIYYTS